MDISILIVFVLTFLICLAFTRKRYNLPPGSFAIPLVGSIGLLLKLRGKRPHQVFVEESKRLGSVFRFYIGTQLFIVLNGWDSTNEALVKNAEFCSDRPDFFRRLFKVKDDEKGILLNNYDQSWKELRRFTLQALRDFGVGKMSIEENILTELETLTTVLNATNGKPISVNELMQKTVVNILFELIFSKRYDFDDPELDAALDLANKFAAGSGALTISLFLPDVLANIVDRIDPEIKQKRDVSDRMREFIIGHIDDHEDTFDNNNIRNFVDIYWRTVKNADKGEQTNISKGNMFRVISDLFLAGSETTSTTLDWACLFMTEHPHVQDKCQHELQRVIGDRLVTYADKNKLVYVNATINEIQRLASILPLGPVHSVTEDITLNGYDVPRNSVLITNLYAAHMDNKYFTEPETFNPERFIDESGKLKKIEALIPFSAGPRICIGEALAKMQLFLLFANLMQRFSFYRENDDVRHSMECKLDSMTSLPIPYRLRVQTRR